MKTVTEILIKMRPLSTDGAILILVFRFIVQGGAVPWQELLLHSLLQYIKLKTLHHIQNLYEQL